MPASRHLVPVVLALVAACGGGSDPSGPTTASLAVTVAGLPSGTSAQAMVTGPGGYSHSLGGSETLTGLAVGSYLVAAQAVTSGGHSYTPLQPSQTVNVVSSANASIVYASDAATTADLTINLAGLPPGASASVHVSGPGGYLHDVTGSATLSGLAPGVYTVTAESVSPAGSSYTPSPSTQNVSLAAGGSGTASVSYTSSSVTGLNLRVDGMYLTQSVQTYAGTVPLVRSKDGFLRVFVTANQSNVAAPTVRVRLYQNGVLTSTLTIPPTGISVPLAPDESSLSSSWNVAVPGSLIQPNLSILADVDPDNTVAEGDETDNRFPASGTPLALDVHSTSTFNVRLVPILQSVNGRQGNVTEANKASYFTATMRMHPIQSYSADVRAAYTTTAPAVDANNGATWTTILSQIDALRTADGSSRYYYGVVNPSYSSGIAGIGYIGGPVAMGWDRSGADGVAAHEWGHNFNRDHAPCGDPASSDGAYPYPNGVIGTYGFDVATQSLKDPSVPDLMGYCGNVWISDYTYRGVMAWREAHADVVGGSGFDQALQPCLLVWGRIENGQPVLEPAFTIVTRPSLPARAGRDELEGRDAAGARLFHLSFTPQRVADDPRGGEHFAFAVPLPPDRAARLDAVRLSVPGRPVVSRRASSGRPAFAPRGARPAPGRVSLRWDSAADPVALVRDGTTGQVLSFAYGGTVELATDREELEVQLSNGVAGRVMRVAVPRR